MHKQLQTELYKTHRGFYDHHSINTSVWTSHVLSIQHCRLHRFVRKHSINPVFGDYSPNTDKPRRCSIQYFLIDFTFVQISYVLPFHKNQ